MEIDSKAFLESLGGPEAVSKMDSEERADALEHVHKHPWYMEARMVTLNDLYAFDPKAVVTIDPFVDIIGRLFKQPKEGLGNDNSSVVHMWRTIARPDQPL